MKVGDKIRVIKVQPFPGKTVAPPLKMGEEKEIKEIILDKKGNPHFDVGLVSEYEYVTSQETGEVLPRSNKIHWCHPSRFEPITNEKTT